MGMSISVFQMTDLGRKEGILRIAYIIDNPLLSHGSSHSLRRRYHRRQPPHLNSPLSSFFLFFVSLCGTVLSTI
ncbi:hypothetical protein VNO78_22268 [Psophocarpus tetragonolobus]|uniref:Uncharacterized protein n=1 Tax=Psophocarpus tetragonolobus TaxID=3891 RepID=A0AAN9SE42_PSOTE